MRRGEKSMSGMKDSDEVVGGGRFGHVAEGAMVLGSVVDHPAWIRSNHLVVEACEI